VNFLDKYQVLAFFYENGKSKTTYDGYQGFY